MDVGANNTPVEVIREGAPVEVIREGAFGGTYFRDIYSGINEKWYKTFVETICSVKKY